ncbi:hypothetical protein [Acinetobacter sp. Ac_5812]|uniref:hypothetical protein n=1 Tax=Acinetobacter sp. Ac_5812 TaxID=1848937 RepID=UPI00148F7B2E|nr:hypothetical protein [Acinetobacter sp. Ac_5812]NNP70382.1 hypothetical protein [Acinetobacter sp. Ac_5812]
MRIVIVSSNKLISASELIIATLRTDLVPVPVSIEFAVKHTKELEDQLHDGAEIIVNDFPYPFEIVYSLPVKSQTIKDNARIGGIPCIAVFKGCKKILENASKAVILDQTSFNSAYRACGASNIRIGTDLPLPQFVCLKGSLISKRLALYLQQEAAVICYREKQILVIKLDALFKQKPVLKLDPSEVQWLNSEQIEKHQKSSYVSIDQDGSTFIGDDTTTQGQSIIQKAGLDARQLKNLEKVLIPRGIIHRSLSLELNGGDIVEIDKKTYVILTAAHQVETGAIGGNVGSMTKLWLASL